MKPYELGEVQLRHLLVVQAISEEGSFWAAAERLGCSQAALSQQLSTLERILDVRLIERSRGKRKIETTEAGRLLLRHAKVLIAQLQALHADFTALSEGKAGTLRVGTFESTGTRILPGVLREFRRKWPLVDVQLTESPTDEQLLALVETGELDTCFAFLPLPEGPFEAVKVFSDPFVIAVAHDEKVYFANHTGPVTLPSLSGIPIVTFNERSAEQVEAVLRSRGAELNVVFRSNYNDTIQSLAAAGGVVALASQLTMNVKSPATRILGPIKELSPRLISLAWHRDRFRSQALEAFIETTRSQCEELEHAGNALLQA